MYSLQDIFQGLGKFFGKGGNEFFLPVLLFFFFFPQTQEEESMGRSKLDLSHAIFFGVLFFILLAENCAGHGGYKGNTAKYLNT
jgi:hypothetical protein